MTSKYPCVDPLIGSQLDTIRDSPNGLKFLNKSQISDSGLTQWQQRQKRSLDIVVSLVLLVILAPLFVILSVIIFFESPGSILFRQPRVGYRNEVFLCFKFRSMYEDHSDLECEQQVVRGDDRVTPFGRWLRRLSLDELPQLLNVIRGEMSLVGPRPHASGTKAGNVPFHEALDNYACRHIVLPGITGLAQIRGARGRTATVDDLRRRVELDLEYINRWSLMLDVWIMISTMFHLIANEDVY